MGEGASPTSPAQVRVWLSCYSEWLAVRETLGLYSVPPDLGTRVQSTRQGRPTERAALVGLKMDDRVQAVDFWRSAMSSRLEKRLMDFFLMPPITYQAIAQEFGLPYYVARGMVEGLPDLIWWRFYSGT